MSVAALYQKNNQVGLPGCHINLYSRLVSVFYMLSDALG